MDKEKKIREIVNELVYEELCARGKAYRKALVIVTGKQMGH